MKRFLLFGACLAFLLVAGCGHKNWVVFPKTPCPTLAHSAGCACQELYHLHYGSGPAKRR